MVDVYVNLIKANLRTVEQVPAIWRTQVREKLKAEGFNFE